MGREMTGRIQIELGPSLSSALKHHVSPWLCYMLSLLLFLCTKWGKNLDFLNSYITLHTLS